MFCIFDVHVLQDLTQSKDLSLHVHTMHARQEIGPSAMRGMLSEVIA